MAAGKRTAADLGAHICFEDEAGQALSPPRARTWSQRGRRPVVHVRGRGRARVNVAGVCCYRPGHRTRFLYKLHVYHGRTKEPKSFSWQDYRDLITATHQVLDTPIVWCWDNLNVHLQQELFDDAEENKAWLRLFHLPGYAPDLNPTEGVWSLLKRSIGNFVVADHRPHPHRQVPAEEAPAPPRPDRRLPRRHRTDPRTGNRSTTSSPRPHEFKLSTPDYFVRWRDGAAVVVDVRPDERIEPADAVKFAATAVHTARDKRCSRTVELVLALTRQL